MEEERRKSGRQTDRKETDRRIIEQVYMHCRIPTIIQFRSHFQ